MDSHTANQGFFHSTINDFEDNPFDSGELNDIFPDSPESFMFLRRLLIDNWNRSNQIIQNQSEKLITANQLNYELTCELINLRKKYEELENKINSTVVLNNHYESLQTPVKSRNVQDDASDPELVLELNEEIKTKSFCKSVSSPAIMTNVKQKEEPRVKKEFRLFNTKISISHTKRPHKDKDNDIISNEIEKKNMDAMVKTPSLISLLKKPKKEQKQKSKRLSSSMTENLRVFDKNS
ncbi:hypothetical protein BpHYR1_018854 [Brachionus plicatilis]|uniref:Uncharacterized protein n=1 Tax=Brachionus plicatilis TaxID=10195 RepID=A0A3M7PLN7_BRAPC|nr:hypothetical protein BpHYR1_018854 [Brachionus plicatilis]